uniref:(northern house mosquito) hypothetical protein n=1 Tax=Culex pipiens TaxID=7175 RepID=A0A8D8FK98_CULPI
MLRRKFLHGGVIRLSGVVLSHIAIKLVHVSSSRLSGRHSQYSQCRIVDSIFDGMLFNTERGVSGDEGGVSREQGKGEGLRARNGEEGGLNLVRWNGLSKVAGVIMLGAGKKKMLRSELRFESEEDT